MAHFSLPQQSMGSPKSKLRYLAGGTAMGHQGGGLWLFNPKTMRGIIRHTYKSLGPTPPSQKRLEYELAEDGKVTQTPVS